MKKLLIIAFAVASLATAFTSCKKDISEEELLKNQLAQADSLLKRGGVIKYTVKVVSTANSSMLKSKMSIENASVTVYQNDKIFTGQTDAMGFVTFENMRVGTVAVNVTLKDHAEVDYVADITPQEQLSNLSQSQVVNTIRYASTMVPMFPIADPGCATITGKVTAELDLTNTTPEPAPGVKVTATVDVDDPDFVSRYIAPTLSSGTPSAGRILKYAFSDANITTSTDAQGLYTLKVPASLNGLPIKLSISDYLTSQKLYLENDPTDNMFKPGEYTVPVLFSENSPSDDIPIIKPLYFEIDKPTCPYGTMTKPAYFSHEIDANGTITKVSVISEGKYSDKPTLLVLYPEKEEIEAVILPVFEQETGKIIDATINNGGSGYFAYGKGSYIKAFITQNINNIKLNYEINENGNLNQVSLENKGNGYIFNPRVKAISPIKNAILPIIKIIISRVTLSAEKVSIINYGGNLRTQLNQPVLPSNMKQNNSIFSLKAGQINIQNIHLGTGSRF